MSIVRAPRPQANFYLLDKKISEDRRLSWAARGMLVFLLGKPDHWSVSTHNLINETAECAAPLKRDGVRAVLQELINAGYMRRALARSDAGKLGGYDYEVSEVCIRPETVQPAPAQPGPAKPAPANPPLVRIEGEQGLNPSKSPHTPQGGQAPGADAQKKKPSTVSLPTWLDSIKAAGETPIPASDAVFLWADKTGLPREFLSLAWREFKDRYSQPGAKRYADWRSVFRKAMRANWLRLWYLDGDTYVLTTVGQQARKLHGEGA